MDFKNLEFYASVLHWPLFPCSKSSKKPLTDHGFKDATIDLSQLQAWHNQHPGCAWGLATSAMVGVLDVDLKDDGPATHATLEAIHGPLPSTVRAKTGGGGSHLYFRFPLGTGSSTGRVGVGIDVRAEGGYVIVPPSRIDCVEHQGRSYSWESKPWEQAIADAPAWLSALAIVKAKASPKPQTEGTVVDDPWVMGGAGEDLLSHPGMSEKRTPKLCELVGIHLARGDSESSITAMAEAWAARCNPPLAEWRKHVEGLCRKQRFKSIELTPTLYPTPLTHAEDFGREATNERTNSPGLGIQEFKGDSLYPPAELVRSFVGVGGESFEANLEPELVRSFVSPGTTLLGDGGDGCVVVSTTWPTLRPEARHGLLGRMLEAVEAETEADPAGVLLGWLTCFGSIVGRGSWVKVGADLHHPAIFLGIVGRTSDAKGVSWGVAKYPFGKADPTWSKYCICPGVGSGQGLIERVRDERKSIKVGKDGLVKETVIPAASDKRCLLRLDELAICFKLQRSESSTLGETLLTAWGGEPLEVPNRSDNALIASDYSIGVLGDTQPGTIRKLLESDKGFECNNGWLNRFLWAAVRSERDLPGGGNLDVLEPFLKPLAEALAYAKTAGELKRDAQAESLWHQVYGELKRSGDTIAYTDRARPYVVRLSLIFALASMSKVITLEHLKAAIAVWDYCKASAQLIFAGAKAIASTPDPLWLQVYDLILGEPGINRKGLHDATNRNLKAEELGEALTYLAKAGMAYATEVKPQGGGRPAERWYPGSKPSGKGDGDDTTLKPYPLPASPSPLAFDPWVMGEDAAAEVTNERTNSGLEGLASCGVATNLRTNELTPGEGLSSAGAVSSGVTRPGRAW